MAEKWIARGPRVLCNEEEIALCLDSETAARIVRAFEDAEDKPLFEALLANGWRVWRKADDTWACGTSYGHDLHAVGSGPDPRAAIRDAIERSAK